jgi:hypothetical protein
MEMEPGYMLKLLKQDRFLRADELYQVTRFIGFRTGRDGKLQKVTIEIFDAGESTTLRFHCVARTEDGRMATGNPEKTVDVAIDCVHWSELDNAREI